MTRALRWQGPPARWIEGSPIGNGRLGAMILGGVDTFHLQINDGTVWSGQPGAWEAELTALRDRGAGPAALERARTAIREDRLRDAEEILKGFEGTYSQEFLPYLDLRASFRSGATPAYQGRSLDLHHAVYEERVHSDSLQMTRRAWASRPDEALQVEFRAESGTFDVRLEVTTRLREAGRRVTAGGIELLVEIPIDGAPLHEPQVEPGLRWRGDPARADHPADRVDGTWDAVAAACVAVASDGRVVDDGHALVITGARQVRLAVTSSTSAEDWFAGVAGLPDRDAHGERARRRGAAALRDSVDAALARHSADITPLLTACLLELDPADAEVVVDQLGDAPSDQVVVPALFQYGRYLLASASREGGTAVNLQGLWNDEIRPPWSSNYTTNINVQMHYWSAETTGLSDTVEPLVHLLEIMAATGAPVARQLYDAAGWVGHHNTDLWGWPLPVGMGHGDPSWAIWMTGGTWLTTHLMEHYRFTQDTEWLRARAWPVLRGAAEFALDWLIDEGGTWLVTNPATSPENHFAWKDTVAAVDRATACDRALLGQILDDTVQAAAVLGCTDDKVAARAADAAKRIEPDAIGADGRLREWSTDRVEPEPDHRHFSPLVGLYPLGRIDVDERPDLARAAAALVCTRTDPPSGWPWSWAIALHARLRDGEGAHRVMHQTKPAPGDPALRGRDEWSWGALLPTFLMGTGCAFWPFQVDVSLGFPAGVAELLVQSHLGEIHLLPALPAAWRSGRVRGIRARGGLIIDLEWEDGALRSAALARVAGDSPVRLRYRDARMQLSLKAGSRTVLAGDLAPLDD